MLTAKEIRQGYIEFFQNQGHAFVPSSRVVPEDDPTLLFTNAGMNQFKDIFLDVVNPDCKRAVNSQKCIRVSGKHNDLEEVGKDTYHHTFFEMLGNWSFGDYFKDEAIRWAWQLLTDVWKMDGNKLWATVFGGDTADGVPPDVEAESLWVKNSGIPKERVLRCGRKDNFWEMGDTGPCGPCSEIHMDLGPERCDKPDVPHTCRVNGECGRFIELWNLVFIQYNRDEKGKLHDLPAKHVDTGAGLERIVAVMQNKTSNYDTDLFMPLIDKLSELSEKSYTSKLSNDTDNAFRVIADHVRTLSFSIADGALPGNEGRGYVLRRILRRATRFGLLLDLHEPFLYKLVPTLVEMMVDIFPEIKDRAAHVANVIESEETSFGNTLDRGIEIFESDIKALQTAGQSEIPGDTSFRLYDTFGFPLDLTQLMAEERGLTVDTAGFDALMEQQRDKARAAQKNVIYEADALGDVLPQTDDSAKYLATYHQAKIVGYVAGDDYLTAGALPAKTKIGVVLDQTCAYGESGGQVGDTGYLYAGNEAFVIENTQRIGDAVIHYGQADSDALAIGDSVTVTVDALRRSDILRNHTATHLLQWALQQVLGQHAHQEGSLVHPDYLRFDFTQPKALKPQQIADVEQLVRDRIYSCLPVCYTTMPIEEGRKLGAMALFSEKYGDQVRVVAIGADSPDDLTPAFSREFCGGTHVANTEQIGSFKIVREESVATGVRRITALTGRALNESLYQQTAQLDWLSGLLKTTPDQLENRVQSLLEDNRKLKKQLEKGAGSDLKTVAEKLLSEAETAGDAKIIVGEMPAASVEMIRGQIDWLRQKAKTCAMALASKSEEGKVLLFAAVTDDLIKGKGLKAGDIVKEIAPIVGGGGGGKPQLAQAGGKNPEKIPDALQKAVDLIREKLA
jgi:alanyl-tRNA synthetase